MARITLNLPIRDTTSLKAMEMVVTPMAIGTMVETREKTPMDITMEAMVTKMEEMDITMETMVTKMEEMEITMVITMETMVSTATTQKLRRISRISHASSARRMDTIPQAAQRISLMNLPSPIHSRRDM
jgi:phosphoribosylaminoimidazole-succinocarboxamide synthase